MVVEDLDRGPDNTDGLRMRIGTVGKIEPRQAIIRCSKPQPGFGIARMFFDRAAKVFLGKSVIVGAERFLAEV